MNECTRHGVHERGRGANANANAWTDRRPTTDTDRDEARAVTIGWRDCLTSHDPWVMYINPSDTPLDRHRHL